MVRRKDLILFVLLLAKGAVLFAQKPSAAVNTLTPAPNATHIAAISNDTLYVVKGSTLRYTVDTPEERGLVSTGINGIQLTSQLKTPGSPKATLTVIDKEGNDKKDEPVTDGDHLLVNTAGKQKKYFIRTKSMAVGGELRVEHREMAINTKTQLVIYFTAGQRGPDATIRIIVPRGVNITLDNTTVNVIGRGAVKLKDLEKQSIGRVGTNYSYTKVGEADLRKLPDGRTVLELTHLDLRPANGTDLLLTIADVNISAKGKYIFSAAYSVSKPEKMESPGNGNEIAELNVLPTIADFSRVVDTSMHYKDSEKTYTSVKFHWSQGAASLPQLLQSTDNGRSWTKAAAIIDHKTATATLDGLVPDKYYSFRLMVPSGIHKGFSNTAYFYSGKLDIKTLGVKGEEGMDDTEKINEAIAKLSEMGGGTLLFSPGVYSVRTVRLRSNVYLYVAKNATIKALKGGDAPEATWFSDRKYRSGLSPTDAGPYEDPENYMTKQDVGHHYFRNAMFFGERLNNVKIIGNGYITGNGNLVTGDRVMNNAADNRSDKMFVFKLCSNVEIGGISREEDLWYNEKEDRPFYIGKNGSPIDDTGNMLEIDRAGHFVLLATGTDNINVHDTYFGKQHSSNVRDIYDFMQCNNVTAKNIYSKVSSDDIIKPGSDCSLGFTRPASRYSVRNIIGDTNCNLFQIGSETADDITDIHVDNIYILGANKAGFSISTNDGGHIKDIHLNCGHTGTIHSRSKMFRTHAPFFISISNRGRIIGASVSAYSFKEDTTQRKELLVKNVNIGRVENIMLNGIDIFEVYAGSSFNGKRWQAYDGSQRRATSIIAGYALPDPSDVTGGLDFKLPDGRHTGYIRNISFNDVNILGKGGNPSLDTAAAPPELGVGQYNVSNLKVQPSYGLWARHVQGLTVTSCSFSYEKPDGRYPILLDDVNQAILSGLKMKLANGNIHPVVVRSSEQIDIRNSTVSVGAENNSRSLQDNILSGNSYMPTPVSIKNNQ